MQEENIEKPEGKKEDELSSSDIYSLSELEQTEKLNRAISFLRSFIGVVSAFLVNEYRQSDLTDEQINQELEAFIDHSTFSRSLKLIEAVLKSVNASRIVLHSPLIRKVFFHTSGKESRFLFLLKRLSLYEKDEGKINEKEIVDEEVIRFCESLLKTIKKIPLYKNLCVVMAKPSVNSELPSYSIIPFLPEQPKIELKCHYEVVKGSENALYLYSKKEGLFPLPLLVFFAPCPQCGQFHLFIYQKSSAEGVLFSDPVSSHQYLFAQNPSIFLYLGELLLEKDLAEKARKLFKWAIKESPENPEIRRLLLETYKKLGESAFQKGEYILAINEFSRALKLKPDFPPFLYQIGLAHYYLKNFNGAIKFLIRYIRKEPENPLAYGIIGYCYEELKEFKKASLYFRKASKLDPENRQYKELYFRALKRSRESETSPQARIIEESKLKFKQYVIDLSSEVMNNPRPPLIGREEEIRELMEILSCQEKRNPLVIGEPGVGKTALIEELAKQLSAGYGSVKVSDKVIYQLNVGAVVAGARFRGQFEERLLDVINDLKKLDYVIIFIDDIHTLFNAGQAKGGNIDASHIFKPFLASGEIRCIGTTTFDNFRLYVENDPAFLRSFQTLKLREPSESQTRQILLARKPALENFHGVIITDRAIDLAIEMSQIFIRDRAQPDKAINILDRACAITANAGIPANSRLLRPLVTDDDILTAISRRSGIPKEKLTQSGARKFSIMESILRQRIIGQDEAIKTVCRVLRVSRANLSIKPNRPDGVFLFAGPTGVGKTELALALTEFLFGDEEKIIRIDMSEFMENISTSKLIGIAPGYVGYHDRNQLTDKVKQEPYSLILLDEIEKASQQVLNLFLQVFDTGRLTDSKGNVVHFDHTIIIMTSNIGTSLYGKSSVGFSSITDKKKAKNLSNVTQSEMMREIKKHLPPEFINRIDEIIFFNPLSYEDMNKILDLNLKIIVERLQKERNIKLTIQDSARQLLLDRGFSPEFGARKLHRTIRQYLLDSLAKKLIELEGKRIFEIIVSRQKNRDRFIFEIR